MVALRKKINGIEKIVYQEESLDIDSEKPLFLQPGRIIMPQIMIWKPFSEC